MNYFIYGYYGFGNYGDELLLKSIIEKISSSDTDASFYIRCKEKIVNLQSDKIHFVNTDSVFYKKGNIVRKILSFFRASFDIIRKTDYFLVGGGTLFLDKGEINKSIIFLYILVLYAKINNKKIILLGIASDIIASPITLFFMKQIPKYANFIASREIYLLNYLQYFKNKNSLLSKDLVFCNNELISLIQNTTLKRNILKVIGVNFIDYYGTLEKNEVLRQLFIKTINEFINRHKNEYKFIYLSMQDGIGQKDDEVYKQLDTKIDYKVFKNSNDIEYFVAEIDYVITMRYHLAVLSAISRKKCFIINHELKMSSISLDFNYPSISIYEFTQYQELNIIEALKDSNPELSDAKLKSFYDMANTNFNWLGSL